MSDLSISPAMVLDALPSAVVLLDARDRVETVNMAAEQMLSASGNQLHGRALADLLAPHATLVALAEQIRRTGVTVSEFGIALALRKGRSIDVDAHLVLLPDSEHVLLTLHRCSVARRLDRHLAHRGGSRSVAALAQTLAHEVKNPLSGIRGAAQLLASELDEEGRSLVELICEETDRIVTLVDGMDAFADQRPVERSAVNIHQVLEHVRRVAENGFARHVRLIEAYDPSLPDVSGDRDQLIQVFLNLLKNAAEAAPRQGGRITISTHYVHGVRMQLGTTPERIELPITVEISDNGSGVSGDMLEHLFEPFVSTKPKGRGLGLSLVAKIVNDHGGMVSHSAEDHGTVFRVRLPAVRSGRETS